MAAAEAAEKEEEEEEEEEDSIRNSSVNSRHPSTAACRQAENG
jgi:hypothetical protein